MTREISGLDSAPITASSSVEKSKYPLNDLVRNQFVESDEEDVAEEMRTVWDDASMARIKTILENNHKYVIFHQNGTLHRRLIVSF